MSALKFEDWLKIAKPGESVLYTPAEATDALKAYEAGKVVLFSQRKQDWQGRAPRFAVRVSPAAYAWVNRVSKAIDRTGYLHRRIAASY